MDRIAERGTRPPAPSSSAQNPVGKYWMVSLLTRKVHAIVPDPDVLDATPGNRYPGCGMLAISGCATLFFQNRRTPFFIPSPRVSPVVQLPPYVIFPGYKRPSVEFQDIVPLAFHATPLIAGNSPIFGTFPPFVGNISTYAPSNNSTPSCAMSPIADPE